MISTPMAFFVDRGLDFLPVFASRSLVLGPCILGWLSPIVIIYEKGRESLDYVEN